MGFRSWQAPAPGPQPLVPRLLDQKRWEDRVC